VAATQQALRWLYLEFFGPGPVPSLLPVPAVLPPLEGGEKLGLSWDGVMWAVPKKRTSYTRKRIRNGRKYLKPRINYMTCPDCKNLKLLHMLCGHCFKETMRKTAEIRTAELEDKMHKLADQARNLIK
jgi:ribosomal protein L32